MIRRVVVKKSCGQEVLWQKKSIKVVEKIQFLVINCVKMKKNLVFLIFFVVVSMVLADGKHGNGQDVQGDNIGIFFIFGH